MSARFQLLVLGGGPGGVAAALRGVQLGARVGLVEAARWGGLCLNHACVPTKLLSATMERLGCAASAGRMGFEKAELRLDTGALFRLKKELVDYFALGTEGLLKSKGVELISGTGTLEAPGKVRVDGRVLEAEAVILATGANWRRPSFPGAELPGVIDSTQFLEEGNIPPRCLLLGADPWALELAQFLKACGSTALVAVPQRHILPGFDHEISQRLRAILKADLEIFNNCRVLSLERQSDGLHVHLALGKEEQSKHVDSVIFFERGIDTSALNLAAVGLRDLQVDEFLSTGAPGIWAVGDLAGGGPAMSHRATAMGIVAAENALGGRRKWEERLVPRVAYTRPQAAGIGMSEEQAEESGYEVLTGSAGLGVNPMAMIQDASNGVIKVVAEERYGEVLGVHILGPFATEIISAAAVALQGEVTLQDLARTVLPHPTIAESLAEAARDALGQAIYA